jgi:hypothetical protein
MEKTVFEVCGDRESEEVRRRSDDAGENGDIGGGEEPEGGEGEEVKSFFVLH